MRSRRGLLRGVGLGLATGLWARRGASAEPAPPGETDNATALSGKDPGMRRINDRPLVVEAPAHLLDDPTTPTSRFFVSNHGRIPAAPRDPDAWRFVVEGEVHQRLELALGEIKARFAAQTHRMVLECGGNGRSFYQPQTRGNGWTHGGVGCAEWTGVPLADLLRAAGLREAARFTGSQGADPHLSGEPGRVALSRGNPLAKAMDPHTMVVWAMNGRPLAPVHGAPVRLLVPGWAGSLSTKWLRRIVVRDTPHDGQGMGGLSYRVPVAPIVPGSTHDGTGFRDLEAMPVRSIITAPADGTTLPSGTRRIALRGAAWSGEAGVSRVELSRDAGQTWQPAAMAPQTNPHDWVRWTHAISLPGDGHYRIWVRATDRSGLAQPMVAANWNPEGYGANPIASIVVRAG